MNLLYPIIFILFSIIYPHAPESGFIVALENQNKIKQLIKEYNYINPEFEMIISKSVGNHGRYKNIGLDYELLHRKDKYPTEKEYKKGLRRFDGVDFAFIYFEDENTSKFVDYIRGME